MKSPYRSGTAKLPKVIYLTGAPAAGKTTLAGALLERLPDVALFEYGKAMSTHLAARSPEGEGVSVEALRSGTAQFVTPSDIIAVDEQMIAWVNKGRANKTLLIDSHQVTQETYGFRIAPFSGDRLRRLGLDQIWILSIDAREMIKRIRANPCGRRVPSMMEAELHISSLASLAISYAATCGIESHIIDGKRPLHAVISNAQQFLEG